PTRRSSPSSRRPFSENTEALSALAVGFLLRRLGRRRLLAGGIAQHIAAAPDRLDIVLALGRRRQLLAQLADEHVDDLELGLVHPAIEVVEEHLLGEGRALAQGEELEDA